MPYLICFSISISSSSSSSILSFLLSEHKLVITSFIESTVLCATWHNCSAADITHNSLTFIINHFFYLTNTKDSHDNIALHRHCFQALDCIQNGNRSFLADRSRSSVFRWQKRQLRSWSSTQFPTYFILYSLFFCILFIVLETVPLHFSLNRSVYCVLYIVLPSSCDKQMLLFMYRGNYFPCPFLLSSFICSFFSIFLFHYLLSLPLFSAYILHLSQYLYICIYIPGPDVPGEGEHKVMDMIRSFSEKVRLWDRMLCKRIT